MAVYLYGLWRDWVETFKACFIIMIGMIYVAMIFGIIVGGIWIYATLK